MMLSGLHIVQITTPIVENRRRFGWCEDINNNPAVKRVLLFDNRTTAYISSTISRGSDGYWEIRGLSTEIPDYSIMEVAIDDTRTYESVVRNHKRLVE